MSELRSPDLDRVALVDALDHLLVRGAVVAGDATISAGGVDLIYLSLRLVASSVETLQRQRGERTIDAAMRAGEGAGDVPSPPPAGERIATSPLPLGEAGRSPRERAGTDEGVTPAGAAHQVREHPPNGTALRPSTLGWYPPLVIRTDDGATSGPGGASANEPSPSQPDRDSGEESPERGLARLVLALVELLRELVERQAVRRMEGGSLTTDQVERMGLALMELEAKMTELQQLFRLDKEDLNLDLGPLGRLLS